MTLEELENLCWEWQVRLRLQDWDVKLRFARAYEIDGADARNVFQRNYKTSSIKIVSAEDIDPSRLHQPDVEQSLVHELLHLHFASIDNFSGAELVIFEQAIDLIAWGLVNAKRGGW